MAGLTALKTGRPARVVYRTEDDMLVTGKRHAYRSGYRVAFDDDGRLRGVEFDFVSNGGAFADLSTSVMGIDISLPVIISPTGVQAVHPEGEVAVARAAANRGTIMGLSSFASKPVEDVVAANANTLFQVYWSGERDEMIHRIERAKAAGFTGCILTVDLAVAGKRERDPRNHFSIPPALSVPLAAQAIARPGWLWQLLTGPQVSAANFKRFGKGNDIMLTCKAS